jgi:hypothetical protein
MCIGLMAVANDDISEEGPHERKTGSHRGSE